MSIKYKFLTFGYIFLLSSSSLFSCEKFNEGMPLEFAISYEKEKYQITNPLESNLDVINCKDNVGEYLSISSAPIFYDMSSTTSVIPQGTLPTDRTCKILNSPFDISTLEETDVASFYKGQGQLVDSCLVYEITDTSGTIEPFIAPFDCQITYLSKNKILAKGKRCLMKIRNGSEFKIRYDLESTCINKGFLKSHPNITPMEMKGVSSIDVLGCSYYTLATPPKSQEETPALTLINGEMVEYNWVNDAIVSKKLATGINASTTPIKSVLFNGQNYQFTMKELIYMQSIGACSQITTKNAINETNLTSVNFDIRVEPEKNLIPSSTYYGDIFSLWPTTFNTQVALGAIGFTQTNKGPDHLLNVKVPFIIDNICPKSCNDGICTSSCNYNMPLAARMTLKHVTNNTNKPYEYVDVWNTGGIIPAKFLGKMTYGRIIKDYDLKIGDYYEIEAEFFSPSTTYQTLKNDQAEFLVKLQNSTFIYKNELELPIIRMIPELTGFITNEALYENELPSFFDDEEAGINYSLLNREDPTDFVSRILKAFESSVSRNDKWPPFYDKVCNKNNCDSARGKYLTLKMSFKIKSINPTTGAATLEDLTSSRSSKVFGDQVLKLKAPVDVKCN